MLGNAKCKIARRGHGAFCTDLHLGFCYLAAGYQGGGYQLGAETTESGGMPYLRPNEPNLYPMEVRYVHRAFSHFLHLPSSFQKARSL